MTPPAQHPAARRAPQLPAPQLPLDHIPVTVYREHDASERQPSGPPRGLAKDHREGRAQSDPLTVPAHTKKGNPEGPPNNIRNTSDANPLPRRHLIGTVPPPTKPQPRQATRRPASASPVPPARPIHRNPERRSTAGSTAR